MSRNTSKTSNSSRRVQQLALELDEEEEELKMTDWKSEMSTHSTMSRKSSVPFARTLSRSISRVFSKGSNRRSARSSTAEWHEEGALQRFSTKERVAQLHAIFSPSSGRPSTPENEDEADDEEEKEERARSRREKLKLMRAQTRDMETKRERAFQIVGTVEHPKPGTEFRLLRWQRKLGILECRVRLWTRTLQLQEETPYFKDLHQIVSSIRFEAGVGILIVLNAICIGWDTFYDADERRPFLLEISEHVFTLIFLIEFFLRILAYTAMWLCNLMNLFDTFLIWGTGVLVTWILLPAGLPVGLARRLGALRILRLARLCKVIRIMKPFKELWMLVQGVLECTSLLMWAIVIGGMVTFMFAVAAVELIAKSEKFRDDADVQEYFGSTIRSMFTLLQIMTFDSWSGIVRPIVLRAPEAMLLFGFFMGLAGIVLFNLMTAVVVKNAYDAGERDMEAIAMAKREANAKIQHELLMTFQDLDEDGSGALSQEEFNDCLDDYLFVRKMKMLDIDLEELPDIFEILDDGDGEVDQNEFIGGMMKMQGEAQASEMLKATQLMKFQNSHYVNFKDQFIVGSNLALTRIEGDLNRMHEGLNDVMQLSAEVMQKLDELGIRRIVKATMSDLPWVDEPDVEELAKLEKRKKVLERKKKNNQPVPKQEGEEEDIEALLPPQAKLQHVVPPSWVIRQGRTWEAKNPGKIKLIRNPELKEQLKSDNYAKRARKRSSLPGFRKELCKNWNTMDIPLNEFSTLGMALTDDDGNEPPMTSLSPLVNSMADVLVAEVPTAKFIEPRNQTPLREAANSDIGTPQEKAAVDSDTRTARKKAAADSDARMARKKAPVDSDTRSMLKKAAQQPNHVSQLALTPTMKNNRGDEASRKALQHPFSVPGDTVF